MSEIFENITLVKKADVCFGGSMEVKLAGGGDEWLAVGEGQSFNVAGNSKFDLRCDLALYIGLAI